MSDLVSILFSPSNETRLLLLLGITLCIAFGMIGTALVQLHRLGALLPRQRRGSAATSGAPNEASLAFDQSPAA